MKDLTFFQIPVPTIRVDVDGKVKKKKNLPIYRTKPLWQSGDNGNKGKTFECNFQLL